MKVFTEEMYDYKDKIFKQMQTFENEVLLTLSNMRSTIERQNSTEDVFLHHV